MEQEFIDIIQKNLPAQVGEILKQRLEQADKDKAALETYMEMYQEGVKMNQDLSFQLDSYKKFDERNAQLDQREMELKEMDINAKVTLLTMMLEAEQDKSKFAKEIGLGLVRNVEFRSNMYDNQQQQSYSSGNSSYITSSPITSNKTETKSVI